MSEKLLYRVKEAAQMLSLSPWTLRAWIRDKKVHPVRLGRRVLFERDELLRWIEAGKSPARPDAA